MMFTDFMSKYNGVAVDFDGYYGDQCMDLMHQYIYDVLNITDAAVLAAPTAKDVYLNFPNVGGSGYFDKIDNSPTGVPSEGDIVFFGTGVGPAGHVCIFIQGDANKFTSFDENWPTGSPCHVQSHTYGYCLGWLHPKTQAPDIQGQLNQAIADRDRNWNYFIAVCDALKVGANVDTAVAEATKLLTIEQAVLEKDKQLTDAQTQVTDLSGKLVQLQKDHDDFAMKSTATIQKQDTQITNLTNDIETLKKQIMAPVRKGWKATLVALIDKL